MPKSVLRRVSVSLTGFCLLALWAANGQTPAEVGFDVASVRANPLPERPAGPTASFSGGPGTSDPEHLRYVQVSMLTLLARTFLAQEDQFECPAWIKSSATDRFDILAKVPPGTTPEQAKTMMQNLLKERFHLAFHREKKVFDLYELIVAKGGPKLRAAQPTAAGPPSSPKFGPVLPTENDGFPVLPAGRPEARGIYSGGGAIFFSVKMLDGFSLIPAVAIGAGTDRGVGRFSFRMVTVGELLTVVQRLNGISHAVDHTGLNGTYDAKLMFASGGSAVSDNASEPAPDIFNALEKQLGLKLQKTRAPLDVIVIDHIDRTPVEN